MNTIDYLMAQFAGAVQHPVLSRLLLASIEFAVLALVVNGTLFFGRAKPPRLASILWLLVLAKPIVSLFVGSPLCVLQLKAPMVASSARTVEAEAASTFRPTALGHRPISNMESDFAEDALNRSLDHDASPLQGFRSKPADKSSRSVAWYSAFSPSALTALWAAGVLFFASRAVVDRCRLGQLLLSGRGPCDQLLSRYAAIAAGLGLKRVPRLVITDEIESPALAGLGVSIILVPSWLARDPQSPKMAWALKHELMHWKLLDPLASVVRELAQALFYFHPAAWWAGRKWEEAAELACDRAIVASDADSTDYAEQLYQMLVIVRDHRRLRLSTGLFATRTQIGRRIAALLAGPLNTPSRLSRLAIVAITVLGAVALSVGIGFAQKATPPESQAAAGPKAAEGGDVASVTISGQVLDPDGQAVPRARVWLKYSRVTQPKTELGPEYRATCGADGRFQFHVPTADLEKPLRSDYWTTARVVAMAEGLGFGETAVAKSRSDDPLKVQLARDVPIRGRILDTEGHPVAGAIIRIKQVRWMPNESLDAFIEAAREGRSLGFKFGRFSHGPPLEPDALVTGPDGRFTLGGIGAERLVWADIEGRAIEHRSIEIVTREMETFASATGGSRGAAKRTYGANFELIAAPSRIIFGTVRDRATGKPIAGATVHGSTTHVAKTDEAGRYQLLGYRKSPQYDLQVLPGDDQPYFHAGTTISDTPGLDPIEKDIELSSGTVVRGRLTDQRTGRPIAGRVDYHPLFPNEYVAKLDHIGPPASAATIRDDGQYAISVFPGPGVIGFKADGIDDSEYSPAFVSTEDLRELFHGKLDRTFDERFLEVAAGGQARSVIGQDTYRALILVNPTEGKELLTKDVALTPALKVRGTVLGLDGQPLAGAAMLGHTPQKMIYPEPLKTAEFEVLGLNRRREYSLLFMHDEQKLGAAVTVRGDETKPIDVRLQPFGAATGRLLTDDGKPAADVTLDFCRARLYGPGIRTAKTDRDGCFQVQGLVADQKFEAILWRPASGVIMAYREFTVAPGETKDLGDGSVKRTK
jgi:beta-lactamase regulating signal transducer with metallopeptidase domain